MCCVIARRNWFLNARSLRVFISRSIRPRRSTWLKAPREVAMALATGPEFALVKASIICFGFCPCRSRKWTGREELW